MNQLHEHILDKLKFSDSKSKWIILGEVVSELEAINLPNAQQISWLRVAIERMSANQDPIGMGYGYKIIRVYNFLKNLSKEYTDMRPETFDGCPIGVIEVATRIFKFDKNTCLKALRSIKNGGAAVDISKLYQETRDKSSHKRDARNNAAISQKIVARRAVSFIQENKHKVYAHLPDSLRIFQVKGRRRSSGTSVSFFSKSKDPQGQEIITGFDVINVNQGSSNWYNIRSKICFNSTFFKSYWIIIHCGQDELDIIKDDISVLGITNTGVMHFYDDKIELSLFPDGPPIPDRSHLF